MLVVAKAPVAGLVKTRLGAVIGMAAAADVAAASLLDSLLTCRAAVGSERCHLALAGELGRAVRGPELVAALEGWTVHVQRGPGLADRLVAAHRDVADGPVVQIGMDTPQVTPEQLLAAGTATRDHGAVLGPAEDGGWWVLALRDPHTARALAGVPMSTPATHDDTRRALTGSGLRVAAAGVLRDVDTVADADAVAEAAPDGHFAHAWAGVRR